MIRIPSVFQFLFEPWRYKVARGGRGAGKSRSFAQALLVLGAKNQMRILCAREIQKSINDSVHYLLKSQIEELGLSSFYTVLSNEIRGKNGTTFIFAGLKHNISNIKSLEAVNVVWIEEAEAVSANSWETLIPTIRKDGSEIWISYNPDIEESETHQRFAVNPPPEYIVENGEKKPYCKTIKVNYVDNPFFPKELERERIQLLAKDPIKYDNVWLGNPKQAVEGAVFMHEMQAVVDSGRIRPVLYDKNYPVDVFYDLGRADQTALWFVQFIGNEYRLIRYYDNNRQHFSHYIQYCRELNYTFGTHYLPHDAESEQLAAQFTIKQQAINAGFKVIIIPRIPQKNLAIEAARSIFDRCVFDSTLCKDGLTCLRKYAYIENSYGGFSKDPKHDQWSNGCLVAGTLVKTKSGNKTIESIEVGDYVWTPCGYSKVLNSGQTKVSNKLITIKTNFGTITATPEHKFFTNKGVVRADALVYNDVIWNLKKHLRIKESSIGYRETITLLLLAQGKNTQHYIGQYGLTIMALSQKIIMYTIKTVTTLIMTLVTLSAYLCLNICRIMQKIVNGINLVKMLKSCLRKLYQRLKYGMQVKMVESGILYMGRILGLIGKHLRRSVSFVVQSLKHFTKTKLNTAHRVVGIEEEIKSLPVYDLTVEKNHCYLANGMLVSNSDAFLAIGQSRIEQKPRSVTKKTHRSIYVS